MAGLLDLFDNGDAQLGLGLLAAAAPRADGAGFGTRLMEGVQSAQAWKQQKQKDAYMQTLMDAQKSEIEQRKLKAQQEQMAIDLANRKQAALANIFQPASNGTPALNVDSTLPPEMRTGLPSQPAVPSRQASINVPLALANGYTAKEVAELDALRNIGQNKVARVVKGKGTEGKEYEYQVDDYGNKVGSGFEQYKAPLMQDLGGNVSALDPYTLKPITSLQKTMTFADKNAAGNLSIARQRLSWDMNGGGEGGAVQAGLNKQFGKAPTGYRWKADGSMEVIPGGPTDQKAQAASGIKAAGASDVDSAIAVLRDSYDRLESGGGITSTKNGALSNALSSISSSGVGNAFGKTFGTSNQSARNDIAMTRPALLAAMMKATGMSAKQMDSNAELKMWMATATDPTLDVESNRRALDNIERKYLSAGKSADQPSDKPAMDAMPPASQHKGRTIRDTVTGKTLTSDGLVWK